MKFSKIFVITAQALAIASAFALIEKKIRGDLPAITLAHREQDSVPTYTPKPRVLWYALAFERANFGVLLFGFYQLAAFVFGSVPPAREITRRLTEPSNIPLSLSSLGASLLPVVLCIILYPLVSAKRSKHLSEIAEDFLRLSVDFSFVTLWFFLYSNELLLACALLFVGAVSSWAAECLHKNRLHTNRSSA